MMKFANSCSAILMFLCLIAGGANATVIYDESILGDLSGDNLAPTLVML